MHSKRDEGDIKFGISENFTAKGGLSGRPHGNMQVARILLEWILALSKECSSDLDRIKKVSLRVPFTSGILGKWEKDFQSESKSGNSSFLKVKRLTRHEFLDTILYLTRGLSNGIVTKTVQNTIFLFYGVDPKCLKTSHPGDWNEVKENRIHRDVCWSIYSWFRYQGHKIYPEDWIKLSIVTGLCVHSVSSEVVTGRFPVY